MICRKYVTFLVTARSLEVFFLLYIMPEVYKGSYVNAYFRTITIRGYDKLIVENDLQRIAIVVGAL